MAKSANYRTPEDAITFNLINPYVVDRLRKDGDIELPPKKVAVPKDRAWNTKQMSSKLLRGLENGDSISKISKSLMDVIGNNKDSAIRNARTMVTGAENRGRLDSYKELSAQGMVMKKEWMATPDDRTRPTHIDIDGEEVDIEEEFSNGCQYPGDAKGPAEEVWMCRCSMRTHVIGFRRKDGSISYVNYDRDRTLHDEQMDEEKARRSAQSTKGSKTPVYPKASIGNLKAPQRPRRADYGGYTDEFSKALEAYREERQLYEAEIEKAIQTALDETAFESIAEAKEWAMANSIKIEDDVFKSIDLKAFNEVKPALEEMFARFPEVKNYSFEYFDGSIVNREFWIGLTDDGLLSANGGFNFNPRYFNDAGYGFKQGLEQIAEGTLVRGDGSFETLVRHEYGHNVQGYIENKIADKYHYHDDSNWKNHFSTFEEKKQSMDEYHAEFKQYQNELFSLAKLNGASEYSGTNDAELFAEGFADWSSGNTSEFAVKFGEFLRRWY